MTEQQKQWTLIIVSVLIGVCLAGYKLYYVFLPTASEYIADEIPASIYQTIGESTLARLDKDEFTPTTLSNEQQQQLTEQYNQLLAKLDLEAEQYQLHFRHWQDDMNAFALMNGSIVITDALVNKLDTPQQLEAVLLHEIGHIKHNHLMENSIRVSLFYLGMSLLFGDISVVSDLLIESSAVTVNISYSRQFEQEADLYASAQLQQLYGSSNAMIEALEILDKHNDDQDSSWLSSHPSLADRITKITQQKQD